MLRTILSALAVLPAIVRGQEYDPSPSTPLLTGICQVKNNYCYFYNETANRYQQGFCSVWVPYPQFAAADVLTSPVQPEGEAGAYPCLSDFTPCTEDRDFHKGLKQLWFKCS